jgi:predicted acylesterase/phospholipase RssA
MVSGESIADTTPLAEKIARQVDAAFLERVAAEHLRGRRLYAGTTDLDAQSFIVWNLGAIAASGQPQAVELFRRVMLASASIPVVFPPVFFRVETQGRMYDEMHVDGGVGARMFYNGGLFDFAQAQRASGRSPGIEDVFVIHNGQLAPVPEQTPRTLRGIASRSLESTGKAATVGDLFRIYTVVQRSGGTFQWMTLPAGVQVESNELFDPVTMGELFEVGKRIGMAGPQWLEHLPGLSTAERRP